MARERAGEQARVQARVQLLGATRLSRMAIPFLLERGMRVVALDPGEEDESLPWFAPVRGLCRDNGVPIGRREADLILDLDPDARPAKGEGLMVRLLPPPGSRSADVNRWLLDPRPPELRGAWHAVFTTSDGLYEFSLKPLPLLSEESGGPLLQLASRVCMEALAEGLESMLAKKDPRPMPAPLNSGRWRAQESFVIWDQPASSVIARIRAASGPWGGARAALGETVVWLEDAALEADQTPPEWLPGTIVSVDPGGIVVATGRGLVRLRRLRPGWRPERDAAGFVAEVGAGPGYQLS